MKNKYVRKILSQRKPFKFLASRLLWMSRLSGLLRIKQDGFCLRFYPSSLSAELWVSPEDRHSDGLFFRRYLREGDKVVDVGANIGNLTAVASLLVGMQGKVYSIEAHPQIYKYLQGNIRLNKFSNIETFNCALGNEPANVLFSDQRSDDQNRVLASGEGIIVSAKKLDDLPISDHEIALLKVDVEGYEKFVFEGGSRTLTRTQCVYFESSEQHFLEFGYKTTDLIALLRQHGFRCFRSLDAFTIGEVPIDYVSEGIENLIAVKDLQAFLARTHLVCKEEL